MNQYKHFISLGYFCSVALELERVGLRSTSSPFDWCIADFKGALDAIENHFANLLDYSYLLQSDTARDYYFNKKYKIWFFHDFDKYHSLTDQLPSVKEKYSRRIERFYKNIQEPTLFVRYISDEKLNDKNRSIELEWIENNQAHILGLLRSFNQDNNIIYIANEGVTSDVIDIYNVAKDENDSVARRPFEKNENLNDLFLSFEYKQRQDNLKVFRVKQKKKNNITLKIYNKARSYIKSKLLREYIHDRLISDIKNQE